MSKLMEVEELEMFSGYNDGVICVHVPDKIYIDFTVYLREHQIDFKYHSTEEEDCGKVVNKTIICLQDDKERVEHLIRKFAV